MLKMASLGLYTFTQPLANIVDEALIYFFVTGVCQSCFEGSDDRVSNSLDFCYRTDHTVHWVEIRRVWRLNVIVSKVGKQLLADDNWWIGVMGRRPVLMKGESGCAEVLHFPRVQYVVHSSSVSRGSRCW